MLRFRLMVLLVLGCLALQWAAPSPPPAPDGHWAAAEDGDDGGEDVLVPEADPKPARLAARAAVKPAVDGETGRSTGELEHPPPQRG